MLESLKRFFAPQGLASGSGALAAWAKQQGHTFRRTRDPEGFAIEGRRDGRAWRLEWGPSQRDYIVGNELRLRMELGLPPDLQLLLMTQPLQQQLEHETFEHFTQHNQTQMGDSMTEEIRWLVLFPKIDLRSFKPLRVHFGGVSSLPADGPAWLEGPLADALARASEGLLRDAPPFVLMTVRGRAYLRLQLVAPDVDAIGAALELFDSAADAALRVGATTAGSLPAR